MNTRATMSTLGILGMLAGMFAAPLLSMTGCGSGGGICEECKAGELAFRCYATPGQGNVDFCMASSELAELECFKMAGSGFEQLDCGSDDEAGPPKEWPSGWPASEVTEISPGVHSVSDELEIALREDWSLLLNDSARFVPDEREYFHLESVTSDDVWALLGFESGDVFVRLNGHDLAGIEGVMQAFDAVASDTQLIVEVVRGERFITTTIVLE